MTFNIGQIFEGEYPPEAAVFCNESRKAYIKEIESTPEGVRRFQIVENPPVSLEILAENARSERDRKITETDYYMMPDYPSDPNNVVEMKAYRQALRDIPEQSGFPKNVQWPVEPQFLSAKKNEGSIGLAKVGL